MRVWHPILNYLLLVMAWISYRKIPKHPLVVYHPYTYNTQQYKGRIYCDDSFIHEQSNQIVCRSGYKRYMYEYISKWKFWDFCYLSCHVLYKYTFSISPYFLSFILWFQTASILWALSYLFVKFSNFCLYFWFL